MISIGEPSIPVLLAALLCLGGSYGSAGALPLYPIQPEISDSILAFHYAPVHYQDTDNTAFTADFITRVDYDGNWIARDNWENLEKGDLSAWVYYSVVESETHWFIIYTFFHPRDWHDNFWRDEHENDFEGLLAVVRKTDAPHGALEGIVTTFHEHFHSFVTPGSELTAGRKELSGLLSFEENDGILRYRTCQESKGHGLMAYPYAGEFARDSGKRVGDFIIYQPSPYAAGVPISARGVRVGYRLQDLFAAGSLWDRQRADLRAGHEGSILFHEWGRLSGGEWSRDEWRPDLSANAPWGWDDENDGPIHAGEMALDPIHLVDYWFDGTGKFSRRYVRNRYLETLRQSGYGAGNLPAGWPEELDLERMFRRLSGHTRPAAP